MIYLLNKAVGSQGEPYIVILDNYGRHFLNSQVTELIVTSFKKSLGDVTKVMFTHVVESWSSEDWLSALLLYIIDNAPQSTFVLVYIDDSGKAYLQLPNVGQLTSHLLRRELGIDVKPIAENRIVKS